MKLKEVLSVLEKNWSNLHRLGVKTLAVFGSTARNEATTASDVDILVTFDQEPTFDQYMETKFFLEDVFGCKVDLVIQDDLKPLVRVEVEKEAVYVT